MPSTLPMLVQVASARVDEGVTSARRGRMAATVALAMLAPIGAAATYWAIQDSTQGHRVLAISADCLAVLVALLTLMFWLGSTREGYVRLDRWMRRVGSTYHDPTSTRLCPRCGQPMDVLSPNFYTGPRSPEELCHRCTHADDLV